MKYSIDTSPLIDAYRVNHPPDVFPPVWDFLAELAGEGVLGASEEVLHELKARDDELLGWARANHCMFHPTDDAVQCEVARILEMHAGLVHHESERQQADPFVIALAVVEGCSVVTSELPTRNLARPRIPDVCSDLGLRCLSLVEMFRDQGKVFR